MNKDILQILDNVRYWDSCPDDYKQKIEKFLADKDQALQLHKTDVSGSVIDEINAEFTHISASLLMNTLSEFPEDWNFCKTTTKKDIRKIMNNVAAQNERMRGLSIKTRRLLEKFRKHYR